MWLFEKYIFIFYVYITEIYCSIEIDRENKSLYIMIKWQRVTEVKL